jgi:type II secretory pathway pseudopilin PulG
MKLPSVECRVSSERPAAALTPSLSYPPRHADAPSQRVGEGGGAVAGPGEGPESGFTMVEIALCLAIIGFALVAIIGVLPTGMGVQKDNREETIINHDAAVWMDAIRSGAEGYNDLTNYVIAVTNYVWHYTWNNGTIRYERDSQVGYCGGVGPSPEINVFTRRSWWRNGLLQSGNPQFQLTNGLHIIGALSRPRIEWSGPANDPYDSFFLNYVVANVRALSGAAVDKFPQTNQVVLETAFSYRMIPEIQASVPFDTSLIQARLPAITNAFDPPPFLARTKTPFDPALPDIGPLTNTEPPFPPDTALWTAAQRQAYWDRVRVNRRLLGVAYTNSHELRLTFRWPLFPPADVPGIGRQTFRTLTGGQLLRTNDPSTGVLTNQALYFFQPQNYVVKR